MAGTIIPPHPTPSLCHRLENQCQSLLAWLPIIIHFVPVGARPHLSWCLSCIMSPILQMRQPSPGNSTLACLRACGKSQDSKVGSAVVHSLSWLEIGTSDFRLCLHQLGSTEDGQSHTPSAVHDSRVRLAWWEAQEGHWLCSMSRHRNPRHHASPICSLSTCL